MALLKALLFLVAFALPIVKARPMAHPEDAEEDVDSASALGKVDRNGREKAHGHAHSFHHFSGPVEGHHAEVSWTDKHGHRHHDYRARPKYEFSYGVEDHHTGDRHGQKEHRDGKDVEGEYHVHEPGGNVRRVKYYADPHGGFFAEIHNYGGNDHSGGTYGGHH